MKMKAGHPLFLFLIALFFVTPTYGDRPQENQGTLQKGTPANLLFEAENIAKVISQIRGLPFKSPLKKGIKKKSELEAYIISEFNKQYKPEEFLNQEAFYKKLGLIPPTMDFLKYLIQLLKEQIGGFYDYRTKTLYIVDAIPPFIKGVVLSHEICHALQDQYVDLNKILSVDIKNSDLLMARKALLEGEATAMMFDYLVFPKSFMDIPNLLDSITLMTEKGMGGNELKDAPPFIKDSILFPYIDGFKFIYHIRKSFPYAKLNEIYQDLPESTEQILHPEKYLKRDKPIRLKFNVNPAVSKKYRFLFQDVMGEFGFQLLLKQYTNKKEAERAGAGWGGDSYQVFRNKSTADIAWISVSRWDNAEEAREFFTILTKWTQNRFPKAKNNKTVSTCWFQAPAIYMELRGADVLYFEGFPKKMAEPLRAWLWKQLKSKAS